MNTMTEETYRERLGADAEGGYIVVDVTISEQTGHHETTTHETIGDVVRLSVTGDHYAKGARRGNPDRAGQITGDLAEITTPAPGWTLEEIAELAAIWDRWHLNDMRAACAHMSFPQGARATREEWENRPTCPHTGYRYGNAWLVEEVPADALERVRHLMRDRSRALYKARGYDAAGKPVTD